MTLTATATDQDLVLATRRGHDRAYEELYARYRRRIASYCHRLLGDHDRADDIAQEVFISALRRLRETDRPIVFRPWIYEIARNACIDEYRRRSRVNEIPIERDGELVWTGRSAPPPEVAVESKQALADLRGAFRGLSDRHHQIIVLRELEGMSYSQIGDRLGMSKMVVESTLFRARRRLTEEYEDLASGRRCEHVLGLIGDEAPKRLGLRERRALASHLEHCRSCRREARARDLELVERLDRLRRTGLAGKVAALLPIPLVRLPWRLGSRASESGRSLLQAAGSAGASGASYSDTVMALVSSGRAAAAAVTLLAAVGGGVATTDLAGGHKGARGATVTAARARDARARGAAVPGGLGAAHVVGAGGLRATRGAHGTVVSSASGAASGAAGGGRSGAGRGHDAGVNGSGATGATGSGSGSGGSGSGGRGGAGAGAAGAAAGAGGASAGQVTGTATGLASSASNVPGGSTGGINTPVGGASSTLGSASSTAGGTVSHTLSGAPSATGAGSSLPTPTSGTGTVGGSGTGVSAPTGSTGTVTVPSAGSAPAGGGQSLGLPAPLP